MSVVPPIAIADALTAVNCWSVAAGTSEPWAAAAVVGKATVLAPMMRTPDGAIEMRVPPTVAAGPPGVITVPSTKIAEAEGWAVIADPATVKTIPVLVVGFIGIKVEAPPKAL